MGVRCKTQQAPPKESKMSLHLFLPIGVKPVLWINFCINLKVYIQQNNKDTPNERKERKWWALGGRGYVGFPTFTARKSK
jgi:hypothetical protein